MEPVSSSVYVHVPFCARKCEYCAFYSTAANGELVERYVGALEREVALRAASVERPVTTVFFGGGTPSLLSLRQWERVLDAFDRAGWSGVQEWTVECNPATVSLDKARLLRERGVTRISMGVQSLDEALLDRLGRVHSRDMVYRSYDVLRGAGIDQVNLDLMFGIPGQTMEIWRETLREAVRMGPEHLSCYEVIYEEDTPLFEQMRAGACDVDEDRTADMFEALVAMAGEGGWRQYEVANFARDRRVGEKEVSVADGVGQGDGSRGDPWVPALACRHNVNYWRGGRWVALGPSASGFEGAVRYRNVANTTAYCAALEGGSGVREWEDVLEPRARAGEIAAFGLRMNGGWPWRDFQKATGFDLREEWGEEMRRLVGCGWGVWEEDRFRLTPVGLRFADDAGSGFVVAGGA